VTGSKEPNNKNVKRGIIGKYTDIFFQSSLPIISKISVTLNPTT